MVWDWLNRWFGSTKEDAGEPAKLPDIPWIPAESNPWGVPVLDMRPVAFGMISVSKDETQAANSVSFGNDDGTSFIGVAPTCTRTIAADVRFRIDRALPDGALFIPRQMEEKWAIYFHRGRFIFIRSWTRTVVIVAHAHVEDENVVLSIIQGAFSSEDEDPDFTIRTLTYLIRSHSLTETLPAPLPQGLEQNPGLAAMWCFNRFGVRAPFATPHPVSVAPSQQPLRTDTMLHIAVARGDIPGADAALAEGVPIDILASNGFASIHWALRSKDARMMSFLLERGGSVDARSFEGATPLMNTVQADQRDQAILLLDHGADPNAADHRGFTALHRAAEMGKIELARLLLSRGADPKLTAEGHTPRSLAELRGERAIVDLFDQR